MKRRNVVKMFAAALPVLWLKKTYADSFINGNNIVDEKMATGPFQPNWASLEQYKIPDWYKNAKFGIWAHWGAQCQPEHGDWYARQMYEEGSDDYNFHIANYGHPSKFGFKDIINEWKAESWNPDQLVELYKNAGAQYFVAMANHHDNFDNFNSSYQSWNSAKLGPKKDLIDGWANAAKKNNLPFGVSVHASHAWMWYETAQRSDKKGALAGVPYDGNITKDKGAGTWWQGYDPQELYAQNHALSKDSDKDWALVDQWSWGNGCSIPSKTYCEKFYNRIVELVNKYHPELVYFDDTALPLWPISDVGLKIAAHMYNDSIRRYGKLNAVITGKVLDEQQRKCMVWDIERGASNNIEPLTWQTDTCIGNWHYDRRVYDNKSYKTPTTVIQTLVDVVSKNGNLLLNIPVRGNGTIDELEQSIVEEVGKWMKINSECIYSTKPWKVYGEGPAMTDVAPINAQGFNEGKGKPFTAEDIRFTQKNGKLYAITLLVPEKKVLVKSLAGTNASDVHLVGYNDKLNWKNTSDGLLIELPDQMPSAIASVFKIEGVLS